MKWNKGKIGAFCILFLVKISTIEAQINSVFSMDGKGRMGQNVFSSNRLMGDMAAAYSSHLNINPLNPASFSNVSLTLIDFGFKGENGTVTYNDSTKTSGGLGPSHLAFLFPLKMNKWGLSFGINNSSQVNYNFYNTNQDATFGTLKNNISGDGNLYKTYIGSGFKINEFSFGASIGLEFGNKKEVNDYSFMDSLFLPKIRNRISTTNTNFYYNIGAQYTKDLNKKNTIQLGVFYLSDFSNTASDQIVRESITELSGGTNKTRTLQDTIISNSAALYSQFGLGISYIYNKSTTFAFEYQMRDFSNFMTYNQDANLNKAWSLHSGIEIRPFQNPNVNLRKYFNRVVYRGGVVLGKSEFNIPGSVNELKLTGGVSLPVISRTLSYITLGAEFHQIGFDSKTQSESFIKIIAQITFGDRWFVRPKFD